MHVSDFHVCVCVCLRAGGHGFLMYMECQACLELKRQLVWELMLRIHNYTNVG